LSILNPFSEMGPTDMVDVLFLSLVIYTVLVGFKRTRAAFVFTGILIIACIYLAARQFNLVLTASVFQSFFAVLLIIVVVIFQEEIKHFFEEVALWSFHRNLFQKTTAPLSRTEVEILARTLVDLAKDRIGALIIIRGKDILDRHLEGEIRLNGEMSEPLLKSLFDPHSIGHDGAVIIEGGRVTHFSCHLPLSRNLSRIKARGTRHAAALGLSEVTDALCLVVSEERGTISVAQAGDIRTANDPEQLVKTLEDFYEEVSPRKRVKPWEDFFTRNTKEKAYALFLSVGLWLVLVYGGKVTFKSFMVPVRYDPVGENLVVTSIEPGEIEVTLKGTRRDFFRNRKAPPQLTIDLKMRRGAQDVYIHAADINVPGTLNLTDFHPGSVTAVLDRNP